MTTIVEKVADAASNAVNDDANALGKNLAFGTNKENKDEKPSPSSNQQPHASADEGRRLYIGNLAYATTEEELRSFFKDYLVESVSIPKNPRTERPVGYAFVDLSTPSEAERATIELTGKDILERKVSVQLARKPEVIEKTEGVNGDGGSQRRQSTRGRGRSNRGRGTLNRGHHNGENKEARQPDAASLGEVHQPLKDITNEKTTDKKDPKGGKLPTRPRERRERGPPADGIPSKTKVMVANLPYELTEDRLKELFKAYEPSAAKIALRPIRRFMIKKLQARGEARKGRGFGFVTLASEELQQKAVLEMNGKEIEGREIAVKVAIDSPDKTDEEANKAPTEEGEKDHSTNGTGEAKFVTEVTEKAEVVNGLDKATHVEPAIA